MDTLSKMGSSEINKEFENFELQRQELREQMIKNDSEKNSLQNQVHLYSTEKENGKRI